MSKSRKLVKSRKTQRRKNAKTQRKMNTRVKMIKGGFPWFGVLYNVALMGLAGLKSLKSGSSTSDNRIIHYENKEQAIRFPNEQQIGVVGDTIYLKEDQVKNGLPPELQKLVKEVHLPAMGGQGGYVPATTGYAMELTPEIAPIFVDFADELVKQNCFNTNGVCSVSRNYSGK